MRLIVLVTLLFLCSGLVGDPATEASPSSPFTIVSWNISDDAFAARPSEFRALMSYLAPDIVLLDEVSPTTNVSQLQATLPMQTPGEKRGLATSWHINFGTSGGRQRGVIASRAPIQALPEFEGIVPYPASVRRNIEQRMISDDRGQLAQQMDSGIAVNGAIIVVRRKRLLVVIVDLQCCGDDPAGWAELKRRAEAREIRKLIRAVTIRESVDGIVVAGDFNLISTAIPLTLLSGPYSAPESGLIAAELYHQDGETTWTWDGRGTPFPSRALDFQVYSPGALQLIEGEIVDTENMKTESLKSYGLNPDWTTVLSDHRPLAARYRWR